jgi:periplasmic mercuric ion binding protein
VLAVLRRQGFLPNGALCSSTIAGLLLVAAWYLTYRHPFPTYSGVAARLLVPTGASDSGPSQVKLATLQVNIPSMDCGACAVGIQAKLNKQEGVQVAQVDFATKAAVIRFDPGKLSPEKVTALIDETGFKAELKTFSQER